MKRILLALSFCICSYHVIYAQQYIATAIPEPLKENADAVIREQETIIEIKAPDNIRYTERTAITILNGDGLDNAHLQLYYNRLIKPGKIKGYLFDKNGNEIRKTKNSDIADFALYGQSFRDDARIKSYDFQYANYPFTVVYETELTLSSIFFVNNWEPQDEDNIAIEKASLTITRPKNISLSFRTFHTDNIPKSVEEGENITTTFTLENIAAKEEDELAGFELFPYPMLSISSDIVTLGDVSGSMSSWKSFGKFYADLNKGRSILPDKTKDLIHSMTDTCTSVQSKIAVLYEYLKTSTRYVSIQLGVGGWQTLTAQHVAEKGYGDCKALTNYMKAMLKEAGITAYDVLVLAGRGKHAVIPAGYVNNRFNHVILCVPGKTDTTWLECTANTLPAGYLSDFTADRDVLIVTPSGGILAHTPVYDNRQNYIHRNAVIHINENDNLKGKVSTIYSGSAYDNEHIYYHEQPDDKVKKHLANKFAITSYTVDRYNNITSHNKNIPTLTVDVEVTGAGNVQKAGDRLFISPAIIAVTHETIPGSIKRSKPFHISRSYTISDTTTVTMAGGPYTTEHIPEDISQAYAFGKFSSAFSFENDNTIKYIRHFELKEGDYEPALYNDYKKLLKDAVVNDKQKQVVLFKKQ